MNSSTQSESDPGAAVPIISIGLISVIALSYEILLMRLFSIIQWHNFAYMIISLALLGYGISGTFVALAQARLMSRYSSAYLVNVALLGLSLTPCFFVVQHIPFNPEEILWDSRQPLRLLMIYLLLTLPFFFVANAIALSLMKFKNSIGAIYAIDLIGAGVGCVVIISLLFMVSPLNALTIIGLFAVVAVLIAAHELCMLRRRWLLPVVSLMLLIAVAGQWFGLEISPYKSLSQSLQVPGTHIISERSSPLGLIQVIESTEVPLRYAPGLSLNAISEPVSQLGMFIDGDNMTVINHDPDNRQAFDYLDQMTSALAYHLGNFDKVLVLGAGGGTDILQARWHAIPDIEAVELNPQIIELVREEYAEFSGGIYNSNNVRIHAAEARGFIEDNATTYDLIQIALMDSFVTSTAGLYALNESYLYTKQALQAFYQHISPGGYLSITRWIKLPARDTLKLFVTAVDALRQAGIVDVERRLILIRGWQTSTLLIKNGIVTESDIDALRDFSKQRFFDLVYYPGINADEVNIYNKLRRPYYYEGVMALLGSGRDAFLEDYKFNLQPATDDRPYFFNFFKWSALPELIALRGRGGMPLFEWGYLLLVATCLQALLASLVLILLPLLLKRRQGQRGQYNASQGRVLVYFFAIGLAFLFIEIAFIQRFILLLHHPVYAAATVLATFLVFAGCGSAWSRRYVTARDYRRGVSGAVMVIVSLGLIYLFVLGPAIGYLMTQPMFIKVLFTTVFIVPLAFCMGMPFPLAMSSLGHQDGGMLMPWAWGVNGCASVISAVLATLIAIHYGFVVVILLGLSLYVIAATAFPGHDPARQ